MVFTASYAMMWRDKGASNPSLLPYRSISVILLLFLGSVVAALGSAASARAQTSVPEPLIRGECKMQPDWNVAVGTSKVMPAELRGVGIDQRLHEQIPLSLYFRDASGKRVELGRYFGKKPVILSLVYFNCPMLCTLEEHGLVEALKTMKFTVGRQFNVITVSFDPHDTPAIAAKKRSLYLSLYKRPAAAHGWHFLTGSEASIAALTQTVGFHYRYDPQTHLFAHAVAIMVLTPTGRLAEYFYGIKYAPGNLRLALVGASHDKIGSPVDEMILYCYRYNPVSGKFGLVISRVLFAGGALMLLTIGGLVFFLVYGGRHHRATV